MIIFAAFFRQQLDEGMPTDDAVQARDKLVRLRDWLLSNVPSKLYRFRSPSEHSFDALVSDQIWGSRIDTFNDPFENEPCYDWDTLSKWLDTEFYCPAGSALERLKQAQQGSVPEDVLRWTYVQSTVVFGRCHLIDDAAATKARVRELGMKYYPGKEEGEKEIALYIKAVPNAELFCENHVETTAAEAWPIAGTGNYNNPEVGSLGTSLTCKAYFVKAGVKGWYRWDFGIGCNL